ncbi:MAG: crossover junction endodeoxyribonuclease RuvC [Bacilli bacterium]
MRILGIDPGFGRTGYGVIDTTRGLVAIEYGCVETIAHTPTGERLRDIYDAVTDIIARQKPDVAAIEQLFFNRNVTTAFTTSEARGVVVLAAEMAAVPQVSYTPMQVKQAVVGYGRAEKRQVQEMVRILLGLQATPKPDDAADALAIAIAHAHSSSFLTRVRQSREGAGRDSV